MENVFNVIIWVLFVYGFFYVLKWQKKTQKDLKLFASFLDKKFKKRKKRLTNNIIFIVITLVCGITTWKLKAINLATLIVLILFILGVIIFTIKWYRYRANSIRQITFFDEQGNSLLIGKETRIPV